MKKLLILILLLLSHRANPASSFSLNVGYHTITNKPPYKKLHRTYIENNIPECTRVNFHSDKAYKTFLSNKKTPSLFALFEGTTAHNAAHYLTQALPLFFHREVKKNPDAKFASHIIKAIDRCEQDFMEDDFVKDLGSILAALFYDP